MSFQKQYYEVYNAGAVFNFIAKSWNSSSTVCIETLENVKERVFAGVEKKSIPS